MLVELPVDDLCRHLDDTINNLCSWRVETNAGIAVRLRGDPDHPYTRGVLCNKLKDFIELQQ